MTGKTQMADTAPHPDTLFNTARRLENSAARKAYLDEACASTPELRAKVDALLDAHAGAGSFLESPAPDLAGVGATLDVPLREAAGTVIGPYKLLQQIGEGGMGVVFLAEQQRPVRRQVALKVIKAGMDTRQVVARFESERQALALMDHPNIAKVLDAGATDNGRPYFVMELVKGIPITTYCDQRRLTPRERLGLFVQVCQAVQHAHQKGIIHRDLKPSNVLIALYDGKPVPKVIDFGVAKATGGRLTEHTAVFTGFGSVVGTPEYMSPEQAELNQLDVDTRSDVYSLGVILYELLTGTTPVERGRFKAAALMEMLRVVREEEAPRPSTRLSTTDQLASIAAQRGLEPKKLSGLVRGELDWIVMKALEKDRTRRYETSNEFALDVQRYLADEAVQACPPSAGYRLRKFARRNKAGLAVAALVLFFLVLLGSGVGWAVRDRSARRANVAGQVESIAAEVNRFEREQKWPEALAAARRAEAAVAGGEADAATAERVHQRLKDLELIDRLEQIRMKRSAWVEGKFDNARANREYSRAFRDYGVDVEELAVETSIERLKAHPALAIPLAAALDDWVDAQRDVAAQKVAGWRHLVAVARGIDPEPLRDRLRSTWGQPVSTELQNDLRRLAESLDIRAQHPATLQSLAQTLHRVNHAEAALRLLWNAQYVYPGDFWLNFILAEVLAESKDYEGAIRFYTAAVSIRPNATAAHNNLGNALHHHRKLDEAVAAFRKVIEIDPKHAVAYSGLGHSLHDQMKLDEAVAAYRKSIELNSKSAFAYEELGIILRDQKKLDEAIAAFRKVVELNPKDGNAYNSLGIALRDQKKLDEASDALRKAIELNPKDGNAYNSLGIVLRDQKNLDKASDAFRKAIDLDSRNDGAYVNLGAILTRQGKLEEAGAWLRKAADLDPKEFRPQCSAALNDLGSALLAQKNLDEAIAAFRKAIELKPNADVYNNLGAALFEQKKPDEATGAFRKAIELDPKTANRYRNLGFALNAQERLDESIAAYRKVIELEPKSKRAADAYFRIGKALEKQGKLEGTIACFRQVAQLDPSFAAGQISLAWLLTTCSDVKLRDATGGLAAARKAVELEQSRWSWQVLGWAHYRSGDWKASIEALEKSCTIDNNSQGADAAQWFFLAMAHWQIGEKDKARAWYEQAVQWMDKNAPKDEGLRRFRAEAAELLELKEKK